MTFKFGAIPSPVDPRDYIMPAGAGKDNLPEKYSSISKIKNFKVLNQLQYNSCVAHAIAMAMAIKYAMEHNWELPDLEAILRSIYMCYLNREPQDYQGEGMITREAFKNVQKFGLCLKSEFHKPMEVPEGYAEFNKEKTKLLELAKNNKIGNYYHIPIYENPRFPNSPLGLLDATAIKKAVIKNGSAVVCFYVFDNIYDVTKDKPVIDYPDTSKSAMGGHAVLITGWKDNKWQIVNSWGEEWADKGIFYTPLDYPFHEAWTFDNLITEKPKDNKGWYKVGDTWHYDIGGIDCRGWNLIGGKWYYFNADGSMHTGWVLYKDNWYWLDSNGSMACEAWRYISGRWYYFDKEGKAVKGYQKIKDKVYYFAEREYEGIKECQLIVTDKDGVVQ